MKNLFNINNWFFTSISRAFDTVILALLWVLCSIPLFTVGASSSAFYYAYHKCVRQECGYAAKDFFHAFKSNFKSSTIMWLVLFLIYAINGFGLIILWSLRVNGNMIKVVTVVQIIALCLETIWGIYAFSYQSRFEDTLKTVIKNSFLLMFIHFGWSLLLLLIFAIAFAASILLPTICVLFISLYIYFANKILEHIFRKNMSEEDLEREIELDRT